MNTAVIETFQHFKIRNKSKCMNDSNTLYSASCSFESVSDFVLQILSLLTRSG
mgnify:CR=1 FL=1